MIDFKYRKDIDGLRAIAVSAVIFSHLNIPGFAGGFVGVDIFFVISGFLITTIILNQSETFSIVNFYARRIRRILPVLFVVIAFVMAIGALIFNFRAFKDLGQSVTATSLFLSNILFWYRGGYFSTSSIEKPLLHTWSLAVEEQFYILFPILIIVIRKFLFQRYFLILLLIGFTSLVASIWSVNKYPDATFYLAPTRAWELIAGSLLAFEVKAPIHIKINKNIIATLGIFLIAYSILIFNEKTIFPGFNAIFPVLGTVLLIHSAKVEKTVISKVLETKALVFIGLISYSLYLWHWPVVAFSKYYLLRELNKNDILTILLIILILSIISFKFIEQPFRRDSLFKNKLSIPFIFFGVVTLIFALSGLWVSVENGMPYRYSDANADIMRIEKRDAELLKFIEARTENGKVLLGDDTALPTFILWGDSHAQALMPAISAMANKYSMSGFGVPGHPPVVDLDIMELPYSEAERNEVIMSFIKNRPELKTVIIAARWAMYANGNQFKNESPKINHQLRDVTNANISETKNSEILRLGLTKTIRALLQMNRKVFIVMDVPEIGFNVPALHFVSHIKREDYSFLLPTKNEYIERNQKVREIFSELELLNGVAIINPEINLFEENGRVKVKMGKYLLYKDDDHLSVDGAEFVAPAFENLFKNMPLTK